MGGQRVGRVDRYTHLNDTWSSGAENDWVAGDEGLILRWGPTGLLHTGATVRMRAKTLLRGGLLANRSRATLGPCSG